MAKRFRDRKKGSSANRVGGRDRGPNTGAWEKITTSFRGGLAKYSRSWNSGYNGPGKGTW